MGATEHGHVDAGVAQRGAVAFHQHVQAAALGVGGLDGIGQAGAGLQHQRGAVGVGLGQAAELVARERARGREHADAVRGTQRHGRLHAGLDAHQRQRGRRGAQRGDGRGGGGIAGDDDHLRALVAQEARDAFGAVAQEFLAAVAVRRVGCVGGVEQFGVRQAGADRLHHRESADAGIEDADAHRLRRGDWRQGSRVGLTRHQAQVYWNSGAAHLK